MLLLGLTVNLFLGARAPVPAPDPDHSAGLLTSLSVVTFAGLLIASILRKGPRGFLARLGFQGRRNEHGDASREP